MRAVRALLVVAFLVLATAGTLAETRARADDAAYAFAPSALDGAGFQNVVAVSPFLDPDGHRPIVLGADVAGVHRSVDGGANWLPANAGLGNPHVAALMFSQLTPGKVYAATNTAIYVSTDFGQTWTARPAAVNFDANGTYHVRSGHEHPRPTGHLLAEVASGGITYLFAATATQGVKRSSDDGATWEKVALTGDHLRSIAVDPADPQHIFVGDADRGLQVTTTGLGAMTFTRAVGGPTIPEELAFVGNTLYVAGGVDGVFRFDGTWHALNSGVALGAAWESITGYQDPVSGQDVLFAGCAEPVRGNGVMTSTDGGATWRSLTTGTGVTAHTQEYGQDFDWWAAANPYLGLTGIKFVAADLELDPDEPGVLLVAGRGGARVAVLSNGAVDWWPAVHGLMATVDMAVAADPKVPGRIYVGNMDYTAAASGTHGGTFVPTAPPDSPTTGDSVAVDPDGPAGVPSTVYLGTSRRGTSTGIGEVYSSTDPVAGPGSWVNENLPVNGDAVALGVGHTLAGARVILVSVTGQGLYRKEGATWAKVTGTAPFPAGGNGVFAWVPGAPQVYALDETGVWSSPAAGIAGSWTKIAPAAAGYNSVNSLALDPVHAGVLYAFDSKLGGVARFTGADSATPVRTTILPLGSPGPIAVDPSGALLVHDAVGARLLRSTDPTDATPVFTAVGDGFYAANDSTIRSLAVGPDGYVYTASNHGGVSVGTPPAAIASALPALSPPTAAANLHATAVATREVDLAWDPATDDGGVAGYRVVRDGTVVAFTSGTTWSDSTVSGGDHTYTVRAVDGQGLVGPDADALTVTVPGPPPDTTPPSTPASLTVRVVSPAQVALSWPASTDNVGVTGYQLTRDGAALTTVTGRTATDSPGPGAHLYSVAAVDAAGNVSGTASSTATVPAAAPSGLTGTYFDTATFTTQKLVRTDPTVNFSWGTGSPAKGIGADTFSVRWTGRLLPTADGAWTFYTDSDQGVRLWIDGTLLIDDFTAHTLREKKAVLFLSAAQAHDVRIDYYEQTGPATMKLLWSGPGTAKQVIPTARLLAR